MGTTLSDQSEGDLALAIAKEISRLVIGLLAEGQRALVIAGAARVDLSLEKLLKHSMKPGSGGRDDLFDQDRPLGTFSAKIALAHRLSLITDEVEAALQMLRKIRNDFAHSSGVADLSESAHGNRLRELTRHCQSGSVYLVVLEKLKERLKRLEVGSLKQEPLLFAGALTTILCVIEGTALRAKPSVPDEVAQF